MKYDKETHKFLKIWTNKDDLYKKLRNINRKSVQFGSINYFWHAREYSTAWQNVNALGNDFTFTVQLNNFPERLIHFIKVLPVFKTESAWEEEWDNYNIALEEDYPFQFIISQISPIDSQKTDYLLTGKVEAEMLDDDDNNVPLFFKLFVILTNEASYNEIRFHKS